MSRISGLSDMDGVSGLNGMSGLSQMGGLSVVGGSSGSSGVSKMDRASESNEMGGMGGMGGTRRWGVAKSNRKRFNKKERGQEYRDPLGTKKPSPLIGSGPNHIAVCAARDSRSPRVGWVLDTGPGEGLKAVDHSMGFLLQML